jgi:hypothetical protein
VDIVERLRNYPGESKPELMRDAWWEIERLRAENERLRAIIENVALAIGADTTLVDEQ